MAATKKLLLIVQLNETLLYLKNFKSKIKDFGTQIHKIKYDEQVNNFGILYRNGKPQFLEYLFHIQKQKIDVGVWSNYDSSLTQTLSQKYFARYFRDLLFILATNRGLYSTSAQPQDNIKIPRQLNAIYNKFPGYNSTNTLIMNSVPNTITQHAKNDMIVPPFNPKYPGFEKDIGCHAVTKYLRGITARMNSGDLKDVRIINTGKPLSVLLKRMTNNSFSHNNSM